MGISVEQHRSRVGSHDNFIKTKDALSRYNVYIPLLIRQANDVEENPGPTISDIIDPRTTVSADYSQGNDSLFGENAGKQCVAMSITAIINFYINLWTSSTLNNILFIGNNLYTTLRYCVQRNDYLLLTELPGIVSVFDKVGSGSSGAGPCGSSSAAPSECNIWPHSWLY